MAGRNSRGTLKAMFSSAVVTVSSFTSIARTERVDDCLDERFRRGGARRHADAVQPFDIGPRDIAGAFDETRGRAAGALRHLDEAQRVGALRAADDEQATDLRRDGLDGLPGDSLSRSRYLPCAGRRCPGIGRAARRRSRQCHRLTASSASRRRACPHRAARSLCASAVVSISVTAPSGSWPMVPTTSGWPAWPISRICRPSS